MKQTINNLVESNKVQRSMQSIDYPILVVYAGWKFVKAYAEESNCYALVEYFCQLSDYS